MKNKTQELLHELMLKTTPTAVAQSCIRAVDALQLEKTENQILGLAAALICMLHQYGLNHVDVLGIADNMIYSGDNNTLIPQLKAVKSFMKEEWEII